MGKYTDDEIRAMKKITVKIAADYLGISHTMVTLGMRNNLLPIGFATKDESTYGGHGWTFGAAEDAPRKAELPAQTPGGAASRKDAANL